MFKLLLCVFATTLSLNSSANYNVDEVIYDKFLIIDGIVYEKSNDCKTSFAQAGDKVLFTTVVGSNGHCDFVWAKNQDNGLSCQLMCQ